MFSKTEVNPVFLFLVTWFHHTHTHTFLYVYLKGLLFDVFSCPGEPIYTKVNRPIYFSVLKIAKKKYKP